MIRAVARSPANAHERLTEEIRRRFPAEAALLTGSGTQALQMALQIAATRASAGTDLVALPAFTCYDVASAAIGAGARVTFYDVDPGRLTPDAASLERALLEGAAAVVVAPLFGYQPDWDELRSLTRRHDAMLIEDAALSFGSRWRGQPVGGLGDLSVISFGRGKGWTGVEGGALLGAAAELATAEAGLAPAKGPGGGVRIMLKGLAQWGLGRPTLYGLPQAVPWLRLGETVFHPPRPPVRPSRLAVRLALETAQASAGEADERRRRGAAFTARLRAATGTEGIVPAPDARCEPGALRLPVVTSGPIRGRVLREGGRLGVVPSYPRPLPDLPQLQPNIARRGASYPGASTLTERLVTVPTHSLVSERDLGRIVDLFADDDD